MTSFTKHRRQPTGKSLVRPKLKVTCLLGRVQADWLQNARAYFWSLKSGHGRKMIAESPCRGMVNYKQMSAPSVWYFPSVPHPPAVLPSFCESQAARRCGSAGMLGRSWLRLPPLRALSETWLSSVFIGSCPGLTSFGGVEEGGGRQPQQQAAYCTKLLWW